MITSPMLWGAGLACALGGAIAGNALGSTPPLDRSTIAMMYQSHESAAPDVAAREPLPDHYALVTREGTVPVAELSTRGLYSQARYRAYLHAADYGDEGMAAPGYDPDADFAHYTAGDDSVRIGDPVEPHARPTLPETQMAERGEPLQLAAGPVEVTTQGNARLIDVEATLAMR